MSFAVKLIITIVNTFLFVAAFRYAAGSLSLKKLNLYSMMFYFILVFSYIGATLIFLGFRDHYLLQKISDESVFAKGYFIIVYSVIALPIVVSAVNRLLGIRTSKYFFDEYRSKPVDLYSMKMETVFTMTCVLTVIGALALIYVFAVYGGIPAIDMLFGRGSETARMSIGMNFAGNQYVKNILALAMLPALSYLSFIYYRCTKQGRWLFLFIILFVLSVLCKTYNLEKAPIVVYLVYFYVIDCLMGRIRNLRKVVLLLIVAALLVLAAYALTGYKGKILSFTNGPLSRLCITQIATLFLHIAAFPRFRNYLSGSSFPAILGGEGIRSGRVVMEVFNRAGVDAGTAGVMNTLYVGEAYANYGMAGVIIGPVFVGIILAVIPMIFIRQRKDPINLTIYITLTASYVSAIVGGFTDFFYNAGMVILVFVLLIVKLIAGGGKFVVARDLRRIN